VIAYEHELEGVATRLKSDEVRTSVRGKGESSFVFAESDLRAVELYRSDRGCWVVELWDTKASVGLQDWWVLDEAIQFVSRYLASHE
jgi:hypothetical protein